MTNKKNFSPYMKNLELKQKAKETLLQMKSYTAVKKLQSTKVEIYNFHKPISKIINFYDL